MGLLENTPEYANKLSPKSITTARIVFAIFSIGFVIVGSVIAFLNEEWTRILFGLGVGSILYLIGFIWSQKRYQYSRWWYEDEGLYIQKGVIWRRRILVPQNRVQHTDVSQGPLERKYTLAHLKVHTAGTRDASVELSGIELEIANKLRDRLINKDQSDAV